MYPSSGKWESYNINTRFGGARNFLVRMESSKIWFVFALFILSVGLMDPDMRQVK